MEDDLLTIREAAELLGVSVDTLRRWDRSGKLPAMRKKGGTHRYYARRDLELTGSDLLELASEWAFVEQALPRDYYCEYSSVFQQRLVRMQDELMRSGVEEGLLSLIVAVAGEIGNNSYDHNIGNWPDVPGTFFGFRVKQGDVVLADRGLGVLHTLKAVKPEYAVISVGARNRYGHPHPNVLSNLASSGAQVLRTDLDGTITLEINNGEISLQKEK